MIDFGESRELYDTMAQSRFGKKLNGELRWKKYQPAGVSDEEWLMMLGPDANNLEHMALMRDLGEEFVTLSQDLQPALLSEREGIRLVNGLGVHDIGEAIDGDESYGDKTEAHESREMAHFDSVAQEVFADRIELLTDLKKMIFDHNGATDPQGALMYAVECLGYVNTALRATELVSSGDHDEETSGRLRWIGADVLSSQTSKLIVQAKQYAASRELVLQRVNRIDHAFEVVDAKPAVFLHYDDTRRMKTVLNFLNAIHEWRRFTDSVLK